MYDTFLFRTSINNLTTTNNLTTINNLEMTKYQTTQIHQELLKMTKPTIGIIEGHCSYSTCKCPHCYLRQVITRQEFLVDNDCQVVRDLLKLLGI